MSRNPELGRGSGKVTRAVRLKLLAILSVSLLIAGCGSMKVVTVLRTVTTPPKVVAAATGGGNVALPASSKQDECIVAHGSAQIIFYSQTREVAPLCRAQTAQAGWRAGGETTSPANRQLLICYLRNTTATVVASVFDDQAGKVGSHTCTSLIASHSWVDAQAPTPG